MVEDRPYNYHATAIIGKFLELLYHATAIIWKSLKILYHAIDIFWKFLYTFREKLNASAESYTGEQTEEDVFKGVLLAFTSGKGIRHHSNLEEVRELNADEVDQVADGGKDSGYGATACLGIRVGFGSSDAGSCVIVGGGKGSGACIGEGLVSD